MTSRRSSLPSERIARSASGPRSAPSSAGSPGRGAVVLDRKDDRQGRFPRFGRRAGLLGPLGRHSRDAEPNRQRDRDPALGLGSSPHDSSTDRDPCDPCCLRLVAPCDPCFPWLVHCM